MMKLGIDIGAYAVRIWSAEGVQAERAHHNHAKQVAAEMLAEVAAAKGRETRVQVGVTGSMAHLTNIPAAIIDDEQALTRGLQVWQQTTGRSVQSMIVLGAQRTWYITTDEVRHNTNCSAGTGAFFEEQATRLQIPLEHISDEVAKATRIPNIAGRCSVFSKTDMIHRMQEGDSTPDILNGLCYSMVRNYRTGILHNEAVRKPVMLAGGVMKNSGVVAALRAELKLSEGESITDDYAAYIGAMGAEAGATTEMTLGAIIDAIEQPTEVRDAGNLQPLGAFLTDEDSPALTLYPAEPGESVSLGIDIGSTSINFVAVNKQRQPLYISYVKTLGRPMDIVKEEMNKYHQALPDIHTDYIAVTGSGREYIGKEIGATLVINEISAQTEGAVMGHHDVDTIFEIGGQDSKYMQVKDGRMTDFEMNKVCAAGTGAFLEEQIKKLGISMSEFMEMALRAEHPVTLGNRCTVFIEGSINRALAQGFSMENVCAGLAYAIADNYLHRVVNQKKIGERLTIQGGIAFNRAVVAAFRSIVGREVKVTPYFHVTGALGAASLAMKDTQLHFDKAHNQAVNARLLADSEASYLKDYQAPTRGCKRQIIGIPRVVFLHKMFPMFRTLFTQLGYQVRISPLTTPEMVQMANQYATADTCYPIKLIYGHIEWLLEQGVDYIILPRLYSIKHSGSVARKDYSCMYMQTSPLLMEQAFHLKERGVQLIMPELSLNFGKRFMVRSLVGIGKSIDRRPIQMIPAALHGFANLIRYQNKLEALGREALEGDEPVFVLISRVYNLADPALNMSIGKHLSDMGCRVVHLEHLEASYMHVEHDYKTLYWPFGQHILTGLKLIKQHKNFYPIYITNHGCGPDTAIQHFFQNEMQGREYLQLEVDEHSSKVGIITRLEAFLYSLQPQSAGDGISFVDRYSQSAEVDTILIPEMGIYSDEIEKIIRKGLFARGEKADIQRIKPMEKHTPFGYAMNKEYYSHLLYLEEALGAVEKNKRYRLVFPIDEGSEVFGQYAHLIHQELLKRGYDVTLEPFYIEDIIRRDDYREIFADLIAAETRHSAGTEAMPYILGEPSLIYKGVIRRQMEGMRYRTMPYTEALLFHMLTVADREGHYRSRLSVWEQMLAKASEKEGRGLYTPMKQLMDAAKGRLDWCNGDAAKYRFAKLLCLTPEDCSKALLINSSDENSAIILRQIIATHRDCVRVSMRQYDLDFEHALGAMAE